MSDSVRPHRQQPTRLPHPWDSPGTNTGVGCHFLLQCMKVKVKSLSRVRLLATPWTAAHQAPLSLGFSMQEYWSGLPFPSPVHESESEGAQLCPTLSDPMDCSLPGSSIHGILQARVLEWGAIAFSGKMRHYSPIPISYSYMPYIQSVTLCDHMDCSPPGSKQEYWSG